MRYRKTVALVPLLLLTGITTSGLGQAIEFAPPFEIRDRLGIPKTGAYAAFAVAGISRHLYVAWGDYNREDPSIRYVKFAHSANGGASFEAALIHSYTSMPSYVHFQQSFQIATAGERAYVLFAPGLPGLQPLSICFVNPGEDISCRRLLSAPGGFPNRRIGAVDNKVYIAWNPLTSATTRFRIIYSTDGGRTFSQPIDLMSDYPLSARAMLEEVTATGDYVYLRWSEGNQVLMTRGRLVESGPN